MGSKASARRNTDTSSHSRSQVNGYLAGRMVWVRHIRPHCGGGHAPTLPRQQLESEAPLLTFPRSPAGIYLHRWISVPDTGPLFHVVRFFTRSRCSDAALLRRRILYSSNDQKVDHAPILPREEVRIGHSCVCLYHYISLSLRQVSPQIFLSAPPEDPDGLGPTTLDCTWVQSRRRCQK